MTKQQSTKILGVQLQNLSKVWHLYHTSTMHTRYTACILLSLYVHSYADKAIVENLNSIKDAINDGGLTLHPIGPLIDYITSPQAKDVLPWEALYTFLVFSASDLHAAKEALRRAKLPVPTMGLVPYDSDEQLYVG